MKSKKIKRYQLAEDALFRWYGLEREEHFISIERLGIQVRVQVLGNGNPLLLVHGGPNAGSTWANLASQLPDYRCFLLDRPGCGLSEPMKSTRWSKDLLTDLIVSTTDNVLDYFQLDRIPVVGSSFGGYWALNYTLQRPERVDQLILEGCPALVEGMAVPAFMKSMTAPILRWLIPKLPTSKSYSKKIMKDIGHTYSVENNLLPEVFIDWYVSLCNNTDTMKNEVAVLSKVLSGGKLHPEYVLPDHEIQKITKPTLWLWGEDDPFGGVEIGKRIHSQMKSSQFISFSNSGHLPWLDNPTEHAARIKEFIPE
jgi:pimeloyl-ACP methyl ester carboxylesterase